MDPVSASIAKRKRAQLQARLEGLRKDLAGAQHARAFAAFLATPSGAPLMRWLEEQFVFGELLGEDAEETAFNLGLRQFVVELRALRDTTERTGDAHENP